MMIRRLSCLVMTLATLSVARADEPLSPDTPYQAHRGKAAIHEIDFRVIVTAPYHTEKLRVWLPVPPSDNAQKVVSHGFETFPLQVEPHIATESKFGNRFAYFEFDNPQGAQIVRHQFTVAVSELRWGVDPSDVAGVQAWPESFLPYLKSDAAVVINEDIEAQLAEIVPQPDRSYGSLTKTFDWLNRSMTYDHQQASLQASSEFALQNRRGHCSDYHGLCSAFGRVLGYPTRVTYGMAAFPKNSPSHCKLEVFLPGYGWVSYDISETQKLIKKIEKSEELSDDQREQLIAAARRRLERGYRENSWFLQTKGTDYELVPPAASGPVKVVRTIFAEADGEPLPEPDPANPAKREYGWMTAHSFQSNSPVQKPFRDWRTLP